MLQWCGRSWTGGREEEEAKKAKESGKQLLERLGAEGRRELEQRLVSGGASSKRKKKKRRKRLPKALLLSAVTWCSLFGVWVLPEEYSVWFLQDDFWLVSKNCTFLVRQWIQYMRTVAGAFGFCFTYFCVKVDLGS